MLLRSVRHMAIPGISTSEFAAYLVLVRRRKNFEVTMVQTHGLTHINLAVRDLGRALRFYEQVFGLREYGRGDGLVHTQAAGRHDIISFAEDPATAGLSGASHISVSGSSIPA